MNLRLKKEDDEVKQRILSGEMRVKLGDPRPKEFVRRILVFIIGVIFVILVWYFVALYYNTYMMYAIKFPNPEDSFKALGRLLTEELKLSGIDVYTHLKASLERWAIGFSIAFVIGLIIGIFLGINEKAYEFGIVPVSILQLIPGLAWYPVTILLFGLGTKSAVFIIAITVISPIAFSVANGLRRVPETYKRLSMMSGMTGLQYLWYVKLPFSILDIVSGLRIGMGNSWRMLISAEMIVGVVTGLGYSISVTSALSNYSVAFACIIIICAVGIIIDKLILSPIETYARKKTGLGEE